MTYLPSSGGFFLSGHAVERIAQRGIRMDALRMLLVHGTGSRTVGASVKYHLRLRDADELMESGMESNVVKSALNLIAVVDESGAVVTCYHGNQGKKTAVRRSLSPITSGPALRSRDGYFRLGGDELKYLNLSQRHLLRHC